MLPPETNVSNDPLNNSNTFACNLNLTDLTNQKNGKFIDKLLYKEKLNLQKKTLNR